MPFISARCWWAPDAGVPPAELLPAPTGWRNMKSVSYKWRALFLGRVSSPQQSMEIKGDLHAQNSKVRVQRHRWKPDRREAYAAVRSPTSLPRPYQESNTTDNTCWTDTERMWTKTLRNKSLEGKLWFQISCPHYKFLWHILSGSLWKFPSTCSDWPRKQKLL